MHLLFRTAAMSVAALIAMPALADEACRRNPEPVCVIDWAAASADRESAQGHVRTRLLVHLRLGRIDRAQSLASQVRARPDENILLLELQARSGGGDVARAMINRVRDRYEEFLNKPDSTVNLMLPDYLPIIDAQRRSGAPADAQETARRAVGFVQAWQARQASDPAIAREAAKLLAEVGAAQLRAGDRAQAAASLVSVDRLAPLAQDNPSEALDSLIDNFAAFRAMARLSRALSQTEALRARLSSLAARATTASGATKGTDARGLYALLAQVAALQGYAGDREAGSKTMAAAKDAARKLAGEGIPESELAPRLYDAHLALGDWASAHAVIALERQDRMRAYLLELLVEAQAEQGQLKDAVETALTAAPQNRAHLLRQAALAATAER